MVVDHKGDVLAAVCDPNRRSLLEDLRCERAAHFDAEALVDRCRRFISQAERQAESRARVRSIDNGQDDPQGDE